jgi:hypothetical protein
MKRVQRCRRNYKWYCCPDTEDTNTPIIEDELNDSVPKFTIFCFNRASTGTMRVSNKLNDEYF